MGKIFNALEKYRKERKDPGESAEPLQQQDLDALLQFNRRTGRLNLKSRSIVKDPETLRRLVSNQLIFDDGRITAAGEKKCEELTYHLRMSLAGSAETTDARRGDDLSATASLPIDSGEISSIPASQDGTSDEGLLEMQSPQVEVAKLPPEIMNDNASAPGAFANDSVYSGGNFSSTGFHDGDRRGKHLQEATRKASRTEALRAPVNRSAPMNQPVAEQLDETADISQGKRAEKIDLITVHKPPRDTSQAFQESAKKPFAPAHEPAAALDPNMVSLLAPQSFESEQFKILRTNLLYPVSGTPPRSVLVTSVNPGDGKSFVAANLAVSVALNINRHVLLLDCDLRKPTIHRQFGFGSVPGLAEYLTQGLSLGSLLVQTKIERLTILPGGTPPPNPSELLSSNRMAALVEEVTHRYKDRLIIIDSPPPTMTAETGVLARMAEGIVLVARYSRTGRDELRKLVDHLGKEKIVGSVLNYFDHRSVGLYSYRYGRKYKNYQYQ